NTHPINQIQKRVRTLRTVRTLTNNHYISHLKIAQYAPLFVKNASGIVCDFIRFGVEKYFMQNYNDSQKNSVHL
ncbi:MAG: hypothetical protein RR667_06055, partial [Muribaculaceae bacterium]